MPKVSRKQTYRMGDDKNVGLEKENEFFIGFISNHKIDVCTFICLLQSVFHKQKRGNIRVRIVWYYVGDNYSPTWLHLSTVLRLPRGYV